MSTYMYCPILFGYSSNYTVYAMHPDLSSFLPSGQRHLTNRLSMQQSRDQETPEATGRHFHSNLHMSNDKDCPYCLGVVIQLNCIRAYILHNTNFLFCKVTIFKYIFMHMYIHNLF